MSTAVLRPYAGAADLRRMQDAISPRFGPISWHIGDLAWAMRDHAHLLLAPTVTLVESERGELLGWVWAHVYAWFDAITLVEDDGQLADLMVATGIETVERCIAAGDPAPWIRAHCEEVDTALAAALAARGFAPFGEPFEVTRRSVDGLPEPSLPDGLRFAALESDELVESKVEAHRAAFAPSRLTVEGYRRVRRTWPYRAELDRAVVDGQGRVLASCTAWLDPATGWGLLEPVGTRPEHQRRGLAAAVCLDALHALRRAGAHSAQVGCVGGSGGCATYHSIGFETVQRGTILRRATAG